MQFKYEVIIVSVAIVALLCLSIYLLIGYSPKNKKLTEIKKDDSGWNVTSDITPNTMAFYTYILTDPKGQKFLVIKSSRTGVSIIPYTEKVDAQVEGK
jgi:hypothetical protein